MKRQAVEEKRSSIRFPLIMSAEYKTKRSAGDAITVNMSSTGILFSAANVFFSVGEPIQLRINWEAKRGAAQLPLMLLVEGNIVRINEKNQFAMTIERYEYITTSIASKKVSK